MAPWLDRLILASGTAVVNAKRYMRVFVIATLAERIGSRAGDFVVAVGA